MIIATKKRSKELPKFSDLDELILSERDEESFRIELADLPGYFDREYRYDKFFFNPVQLKCSCEDQRHWDSLFPGKDIRKVCRHIFSKIKYNVSNLVKILIEDRLKHGSFKLVKCAINDDLTVYLGIRENTEWVSVYAPSSSGNYVKYGYDAKRKRWSYGIGPERGEEIVSFLSI